MNKKVNRVILISTLAAMLFCVFVFVWWIYSLFSYPLTKITSNSDYDSFLKAPLPKAVTEASGVALNNNFYILGGIGPIAQTYSTFYCYDNQLNTWERLTDYPFRVSHAGFVSGAGKLYVAGGFKPLGIRLRGFMFANWKPLSTLMIFDPLTKEWSKGPDMPNPRGAGGICYYDSSLYYVGGIDQNKQDATTFFRYSLRTNKWETLPSMPTSRDHLRMEAVNGILYAISGRKDDLRFNLGCVEAFDLKTQTWSEKAPIPTPRGGFGSTVCEGKIYTFGGEYVWRCFDVIEEYDPATNKWRSLTKLPEPRHGICAGVIDNEIHLVSGGLKPRISISNIHRVIKIR
jgi:N-acetylneuraminic acid mutarotase